MHFKYFKQNSIYYFTFTYVMAFVIRCGLSYNFSNSLDRSDNFSSSVCKIRIFVLFVDIKKHLRGKHWKVNLTELTSYVSGNITNWLVLVGNPKEAKAWDKFEANSWYTFVSALNFLSWCSFTVEVTTCLKASGKELSLNLVTLFFQKLFCFFSNWNSVITFTPLSPHAIITL